MNDDANLEAFKDFEHDGWEKCVSAYDRHFGPLTQQVIPSLLAEAGAQPSVRLLDVACGPGYVASQAFELGCAVSALDISEGMIAKAKARYASIDFVVGDAEALPFPDRSFDAVTMNFGILHLARPEHAAHEAWRVLKPGGRFAFTVWSAPDQSIAFQIVLRAIERHGSTAVQLPQGPPFFKYTSNDEGRGLLTGAGFSRTKASLCQMSWSLPSVDALFEAFYEGTARTGGSLRAQPEENRRQIKSAVDAATEPYRKNGTLQVPMSAWIYVGTKAASEPTAREMLRTTMP